MPRLTRRAEPARDKAREASLALVVPDLESEALLRSTLDSLSAHIAVLDGHGAIVAVNKAWRQFARESGYVGHGYGVGLNYLSVCEAGAQLSREASETAVALREIIAGRRRDFRMEYPCASSRGQRWFQARITRPEQDGSQRIVVAHEDITEVKEAHEELARLTARVMQLQDDERRSIARELHDTTAQNLLAVTLNVTRIRERLRSGTPPTDRALAETLELAEQSLQEVRTLSYLLHPPLLDVVGLGSALRWLATGFAERSGVAVEVAIGDGMESLPQDVATALFRVAQECLANVHRHSGSAWARIILSRSDQGVRLKVLDGGRGFERKEAAAPKATANVGVGLSGMRVRVRAAQGHSGGGVRCVGHPRHSCHPPDDHSGSFVSVRILLADDHEIVRRGLKELLEEQVGWTVCGEAANGREAVDLAVQRRPDVAVLDFSMPELNGLEATRRIRQVAPLVEVLVFTMHESEELIREVLSAGARGYLLKSDATRQLIPAVQSLARHKPFFSGRVSEVVLEGFLKGGAAGPVSLATDRLTSREREIIQLLAEGNSNKDIARRLTLSVKTVETHRAAVMRKLELSSLADIIRWAIRNNFIQP